MIEPPWDYDIWLSNNKFSCLLHDTREKRITEALHTPSDFQYYYAIAYYLKDREHKNDLKHIINNLLNYI